ncbi:hypothetical protein C7212DRAFT_340500 [Tuber magnatum]|uniref:Uncharacterized protein n=1 Tax=Tuber magnatum TaxID=42249 RepID=A0A317SZ95_9PEZI|nr:hypothetical protein C7212DRAFT_340500 [Tuber magnatum]
MQGLYDEMWGKQLQVIKDHIFSIPYPGDGFRLGYKADLKELGDEAFPDLECTKGKAGKVFKVLKVSNSHHIKTNANYLFYLPEDQKKGLWILTDKELTDTRWTKSHAWFVVLAASLVKAKASNQWKKDRNVALHYMDNWGWDEIVAAFTY